jgi:hypothetical protein
LWTARSAALAVLLLIRGQAQDSSPDRAKELIMKSIFNIIAGAAVVTALALMPDPAWAQARGQHGGGGGARTNSGGGGGGGTAVSRGSGGGGSHVSTGGGQSRGSSGDRVSGPTSGQGRGTAVQRGGTRTNVNGNPSTGRAVERVGPYYGRYDGRGNRYSYYPYDPYYLYGYGAFGLGAFYYDPFWWGGYPYGYGVPYGYGYGGYGGYYDYDRDAEGPKGGLKLKVEPKDAEVYVDGYYVGTVDDYDGTFQRLSLLAGTHRVEIRAKGYETVNVDVKIEPRETITYRADLQLQAPPRQ